jgi:hypothetical protein
MNPVKIGNGVIKIISLWNKIKKYSIVKLRSTSSLDNNNTNINSNNKPMIVRLPDGLSRIKRKRL